jgi:RNA polymerase sigma-70 factor (ECF subfamily)
MLRDCPPEHRAILQLRREGFRLHEIAARTGLHEGSVRRVLRQLARDLALRHKPLPAAGDPA